VFYCFQLSAAIGGRRPRINVFTDYLVHMLPIWRLAATQISDVITLPTGNECWGDNNGRRRRLIRESYAS